jgi:hypothetical protein
MRAHILLNGGRLQRASAAVGRIHERDGGAARRACCWLAGAALAAFSSLALSADISWRDIESRIQYDYYTEDAPALRNLAETVAAVESHDKLRGYYAGLLAWRQALLTAHGVSSARGGAAGAPTLTATQFAEHCVSEVDAALAVQADFAEALALRSACLATPSATGGGFAPVTGYRARRDLEKARELAARNPRVMLVDAMTDYQLAPSKGGNKERALVKLRQTVAAFEAERSGTEHLPGWGAAEAWLLLAEDLLDHGDALAARDALEHALLIAPEFAEARRLMAKMISG